MKELEYPIDVDWVLLKKRSIKRILNSKSDLIEKRVAIISGSTIGEIKNLIEIFLLNEGIKPIFWLGNYNRFYEDIVFENKELEKFKPDFFYIHTSQRNIQYYPHCSDKEEVVEKNLKNELQRFYDVWENIAYKYHSIIIQNNFELPLYRIVGNSAITLIGGRVNYVNRLNDKLVKYQLKNNNFFINDILYTSAELGLNEWYDEQAWYLYKYPFSMKAQLYVAKSISSIIKAVIGKNKKAIITDLDNTMWGGVIGDDGIEGIKLGIETPEGMAFSDYQRYLKELTYAGILLNICSKNERENALIGLSHPYSELKAKDFIEIIANWEEKPNNIKDILKNINLLSESIVFCDDNKMERELVEKVLPEIAIPKFQNVIEYVKTLDKSGYFEILNISKEDEARTLYYKENIMRKNLEEKYLDYEEYLLSLELKCEISKFNNENIQRVTQLINKTNQFNLTTIRYTQEELEEYIRANNEGIAFSLRDKFGENGIISCIMLSYEKNSCSIDLWVMSCRVFKRKLEYTVFDEVVRRCRVKNIDTIKGRYIPTKKNNLVSTFYDLLGFEKEKEENGVLYYKYRISKEYKNKNTVMEVKINE